MQKTSPRGGFHDWHCEVNDLGVVDRCVAWMLYLNDIPEGEGETEFLWQGLRVQTKSRHDVNLGQHFTLILIVEMPFIHAVNILQLDGVCIWAMMT